MLGHSLNSQLGNASVRASDGHLSKEKSVGTKIFGGFGWRIGRCKECIGADIWGMVGEDG